MPEIVHYSEGRLVTDGGQNIPDTALTQSGTSVAVPSGAANASIQAALARALGWIVVTDPAYGMVPSGSTADAATNLAGLQAAVTAAEAGGQLRPIWFGPGNFCVNTGLVITQRGHRFYGVRSSRSGGGLGTQLTLTGTPGPMFQIGTDDGGAWDANSYNGPPDTEFFDLYFTTNAGTLTALSNGQGNYYPGTYCVQAWRGGHVKFERCWAQKFDFTFWGIQSDYNEFDLNISESRVGVYLGPRSDQAVFHKLNCAENDTDLWIDGAMGALVERYISVGSGSTTAYPLVIGSAFSRGAHVVKIESLWLEQEQSYPRIRSFVGVCPHLDPGGPNSGHGFADAFAASGVVIESPLTFIGPNANATSTALYLIEMGANADRVVVRDPGGPGIANFAAHVSYLTGAAGSVSWQAALDRKATTVNNGAAPAVSQRLYQFAQETIVSSLGRLNVQRTDGATAETYFIESDTTDTTNGPIFRVGFPNGSTGNDSGNQTKLLVQARFVDGTAAPTTLVWNKGDFVRNKAPSVAGSAGSQYVTFGWVCTVAGTPGTWVEVRTLTGT